MQLFYIILFCTFFLKGPFHIDRHEATSKGTRWSTEKRQATKRSALKQKIPLFSSGFFSFVCESLQHVAQESIEFW